MNEAAKMQIKPVRTKRDYEAALRTIETLMTARRNTPEGDRLDVLIDDAIRNLPALKRKSL